MSKVAKKYDGCSGGMSFFWKNVLGKTPPWEGCCDAHDQRYAVGGTEEQRWQADLELKACVTNKGHPNWASVMWVMVRMGGVPWLPLPWRWGFDTTYWNYSDVVQDDGANDEVIPTGTIRHRPGVEDEHPK
ncbi:MAG: hypothetical protein M3H12_04455 [Chromatiales bacterium]